MPDCPVRDCNFRMRLARCTIGESSGRPRAPEPSSAAAAPMSRAPPLQFRPPLAAPEPLLPPPEDEDDEGAALYTVAARAASAEELPAVEPDRE